MLNRRYLRIKVYHALYALRQGEAGAAARIEKELVAGVERTHGLYLSLLSSLGQLRHAAILRAEERTRKHMPTAQDRLPHGRLADNMVLAAIAGSERLMAECNARRISWNGHHELFQKLLRQVEASPLYHAYLEGPEPTFSQQQRFVVQIFSELVANHEPLQEVFEGRSIHWLEDLDLAATLVKRSLEQLNEKNLADVGRNELARDAAEEHTFISRLYRKCIQYAEEHERLIADRASNWESDRIAQSDMILMQMALTEAREFEEIPVKVTLNEYIEIAKAYSTPKSKAFINGILDRIFAEMREDGRIRKVGRGLLES